MKKNNLLFLLLVALFIGGLTSCNNERTVFEEYQKFDGLSWNRFNIVKFEAPIETVEPAYDIYINIRHLPEVSYGGILINFTLYSPSGDMRTTDYNLDLRDNEDKPLSKCMGDYCDLLVPLRKSHRFYEIGIVRFEIENKYTKVDMPGILEVGLIVKESNQKDN